MQPNAYHHQRSAWYLWLIGGSIPVVILIGSYYHWSMELIVCYAVIVGLVFGAMTIWHRANQHVTGTEWWQDDSASGWRGF
ncbi:MAG: hypothetical protein CL610_28200 [Anaerolineaceae bacterium]|nr:hypothetical protein [Anaerolineaceae bacterium]